MASPASGMVIKISGNIEDLKRAMDEGTLVIQRTMTAAERLSKSFSGDAIIAQAKNIVTAFDSIEGGAKLTAKEALRNNHILDEALAKYEALGREVPAELQRVHDAMSKVIPVTQSIVAVNDTWAQSVTKAASGYLVGMASFETAKRAIGALTDFVGESVTAFAEAERAQQSLATAMRVAGIDTEGNKQAFADLAAEMQRTTIYEDDQVTSLIAMATQLGVMPTQMDAVIKTAADLATGLGKPIETALMMLVRANNDSVTSLKKLGISLDETRMSGEGLPYVIAQVQAGLGGQAAAEVDTYAGALKQLENAWGALKESVGEIAVTLAGGASGLRELRDAVVSLGEAARVIRELPTWLKLSPIQAFSAAWAQAWVTAGNAPKKAAKDITDGEMAFKKWADTAAAGLKKTEAHAKSYLDKIKADADEANKRLTATEQARQKALDAISTRGAINDALATMKAFDDLISEGLEPTVEFTRKLEKAQGDLAMATGALTERALIPAGRGMQDLLKSAQQLTLIPPPPFLSPPADTREKWRQIADAIDGVPEMLRNFNVVAQKTPDALKAPTQAAGEMERTLGQVADVFGDMSRVAEMAGKKTEAAILSLAQTTISAFVQGGPAMAALTVFTFGLSKMFEASAQAEAQMAAANAAATAAIQQNWTDLKAAVEKYGFSLSDLSMVGDLALGELATALSKTYGHLTDGGIESSRVVREMSTEIRDLEAQYAKLGVKPPADLQRLIDLLHGMDQAAGEAVLSTKEIDAQLEKLGKRAEEVAGEIKTIEESIKDTKKEMADLKASGEPTWASVKAAADKYGVTLDQLGPKVAQLRVNDASKSIIDDFNTLTAGGADVGGVLVGMSDEINQVVQDSQKFGTTIPENMRPMIEELAKSGRLLTTSGSGVVDFAAQFEKLGIAAPKELDTILDRIRETGTITDADAKALGHMDAEIAKMGKNAPANAQPAIQAFKDALAEVEKNGTAIGDIKDLKWGAPVKTEADVMKEAMDKLVATLDQLVLALNTKLGEAAAIAAEQVNLELDKIPTTLPIGIDVTTNPGGRPGGQNPGGTRPGDTDPYTGGGSRGSYAGGTYGQYVDFGAGTPVTLHGRERVVTEAEGRRGGSGGGSITLVSPLSIDGREIARAVAKYLPSELAAMGY